MHKLIKAIRSPAHAMRSIRYRLTSFWKTRILKEEFHVALARWFADDGDNTLRFNYPLDNSSLVFDLGGYQGDFAQRILDAFGCSIYLFEPSTEFFRVCQERFKNDPRVSCFNFALSDHDGQDFLSANQDGSSIRNSSGTLGEAVAVRRISGFLLEHKVSRVDLIKINIEGGEFDVLPDIIESGMVRVFQHMQIQFHNFIPDAKRMRDEIRESLKSTHTEAWNYPFVWESWTIRASGN